MVCESQSGAARSERAHSNYRYTSGRQAVSAFGGAAAPSALLLAFIGAAGCASATRQPPALDAAFARIQVHEAGLERARLNVQRSDAGCEQACAAAHSAEREQAALCHVARDIDDADALLRCRRAHHVATSLNAQAKGRCGCR
jgi:hypothetical protein